MLRKRRSVLILLGLVAAALAGCYGSTEPASDVGPESAVLNGKGTANNGPASSVFFYKQTGSLTAGQATPPLRWPAGAEGPVSQKVDQLAADTSYDFQLCGADQGAADTVCAQTRTFRTAPAVEDAVFGEWFHPCCSSLRINAHASPTGANPRGSMSMSIGSAIQFTGFVTCLKVDGRRAAVGAVGQEDRLDTPPPNHFPAIAVASIIDGHVTGMDSLSRNAEPGTTPPDCSKASFDGLFQPNPDESTFVVNDAQASAPTAR